MAMISPLESANLLTELSAYAYTFTKSQRLTIIAIRSSAFNPGLPFPLLEFNDQGV